MAKIAFFILDMDIKIYVHFQVYDLDGQVVLFLVCMRQEWALDPMSKWTLALRQRWCKKMQLQGS